MKQLLLSFKPNGKLMKGVPVAETFFRPDSNNPKDIFMRVDICKQIRWQYKELEGEYYTIVNLRTGNVFGIPGEEIVIPLYHAAVLEDVRNVKF